MDLYKDILSETLSKHRIKICFDNLKTDNPNEIVETVCYKTIQSIRKVLSNETLDDFECIEIIVKLLEGIGSDAGNRHDSG